MKIDIAYYVGTNVNSFRQGEPAAIQEVRMYSHDGRPLRACFHVLYADGVEDWCVISDYTNYEIVSSERISKCYYLKGVEDE